MSPPMSRPARRCGMKNSPSPNNAANSRNGIALIFALIVLAVLAVMAYSTASKVVAVKHRSNYVLDYTKSKYACDSATRLGIQKVSTLKFDLKNRSQVPDFSELFALSDEDYDYMLNEFALNIEQIRMEKIEQYQESLKKGDKKTQASEQDDEGLAFLSEFLNMLDIGDANSFGIDDEGYIEPIDPNKLFIPGPYGPKWPYLTEPLEIKIGDVEVTVTFEDENAKLPIVWALMQDKSIEAEKKACVAIFCEWMDITEDSQLLLWEQFEQAREIKYFEIGMEPISVDKKETVRTRTVVQQADGSRKSEFKDRTRVKKAPRSAAGNNTDFARLVDAKINLETFKNSYYMRQEENALKYLGVWGSDKVNINTAPRNVLEAVFVFAGQEVRLADAVISERQAEPFESMEDLSRRLYGFSNLDKLENMILFTSEVFTVNVKAVSGAAVTRSTTAILFENKKFTKITTVYN